MQSALFAPAISATTRNCTPHALGTVKLLARTTGGASFATTTKTDPSMARARITRARDMYRRAMAVTVVPPRHTIGNVSYTTVRR